jgi:hypothetical protein
MATNIKLKPGVNIMAKESKQIMKLIIIGLIFLLFVACSGNDASGLYNFGKAKYNEAIQKGIAYKDSVNRLDSGWVLLFRDKRDRCVYGNKYDANIFTYDRRASYYKCDDTIIKSSYRTREELSVASQSDLKDYGF